MEIIKPLSEDVQSMVRSGFIIGCLTTVVEELIYNSLDAGATKVFVSLAVNNGYVKVDDDGCGISRSGLVLLGERYATSKVRHFHEKDNFVGTFGFRGEVLCSIADISLVEIVTRVQGRPNGYRKVMKGHRCLCLSIDNDRQAVGTTVIVRDLFYNQPVRRRQMQCSAKKVLHSVKKCAVRMALVQPNVFFKVIDMESEDELLCTRSCPSPLSLLCCNFGIKASSLHELSYSEGPLILTGYVSALSNSLSSKAVQYIYVNARFVVKGPIHKLLNRLADMGHDQLRGDIGVKRTQPQSPLYCLNLTCPRNFYDLNLEFSRAFVEFKDWAPVLAFIEKSVMSLWSKEIKRGIDHNHEADWIRKDLNENVVEKTSSVEKAVHQGEQSNRAMHLHALNENNQLYSVADCWLKTCKMSTKRRKIQRSENQHGCTKEPLELQVDDSNDVSHWDNISRQHLNSDSVTVKFRKSETERESFDQMGFTGIDDTSHSNCIFDVKDCIDNDQLEPNEGVVNSDFLRNSTINMETEANYEGDCRSSSRWGEEDSTEDPFANFHERARVWNFDFMPENGKCRDNGAQAELLLQSSSCANPFQTPLDCNKESQFQIGNFKANRSFSNSNGNADADVLGQNFDIFQMAQCHSELANTWPLPNSEIGRCTRKDLDVGHLEYNRSPISYGGSFVRDCPLESSSKRGRMLFPCSPTICDQESAIKYPILKSKDWDFDNLIQEEGFKKRLGVRNGDGSASELLNYDKEEFFRSGLDNRCSNGGFSSMSCLGSRSHVTREYAGVDNGMWEFSTHGYNVDEIALIRSDSFQGIFSPSTDRRHTDTSVCCNPLISPIKGIEIDLQECQELGLEDDPIKRTGRTYDSPDDLFIDSCDDVVTSETFSQCSEFQCKLSPFKPPVPCFSPVSAGKGRQFGLPLCQVLEPNYSSLEPGSCLRTRSHSAPPFYRGKKKFLSVTSSTTKSSALQAGSQACTVSERTRLKHPSRLTLSCSVNHQSDEMRLGEDSPIFVEQKVKETSNITQVSWSQDGNTEAADFSSSYLMKVQDSEILQTKWREGCSDGGLKEISNLLTAGDRLNGLKDEKVILDIQSSMLDLSGDSLVPKSISRSGLQNAKVLWQIDNKYIPIVGCGTLAVIDQHAADERIQLEEMRQKVLSGELKSINYLEKEKDLVLPEMDYQLLCNYGDHIKHWGWICNIFSEDSRSFAKNLNLLNERASNLTLIAVPCILGVNLSDADLVEYIEQLADTDGSSTIPPSVIRILNYKACRGAIMFGDKLLPSECSLIVEELKRTSLCFQCAHGRPTTVPLVDLKALHKGILHLRSWHDHPRSTWHGLCKNKISLDRVKHRLDVARGCG